MQENDPNAKMLDEIVGKIVETKTTEDAILVCSAYAVWCVKEGWLHYAARIAAKLAHYTKPDDLSTIWCDVVERAEILALDETG